MPCWEDDDFDDLLIQTPEFQAMMARSRASIEAEGTIPLVVLVEELQAAEEAEGKLNADITAR